MCEVNSESTLKKKIEYAPNNVYGDTGEEEVEAYTLTYEDKEGVWVVAGDVAWRYVKN